MWITCTTEVSQLCLVCENKKVYGHSSSYFVCFNDIWTQNIVLFNNFSIDSLVVLKYTFFVSGTQLL